MTESEIVEYARKNLERIECHYDGPMYRCAAYLTDGVYLPCVVIADVAARVRLAKHRFEETLADSHLPESKQRFGAGMRHDDIVRVFVAGGNHIDSYAIARLEKSRFAIPRDRMREIKGETKMSWTQFVAVMKDGKRVAFGTTFFLDFFDMPDGYSGEDIVEIISHGSGDPTYRERPFFRCFVEGL